MASECISTPKLIYELSYTEQKLITNVHAVCKPYTGNSMEQ